VEDKEEVIKMGGPSDSTGSDSAERVKEEDDQTQDVTDKKVEAASDAEEKKDNVEEK